MMEKRRNYLVHYGIRGMKWKNHTYKSIVGGEYIYDTAQITNTAAQMKKQGYSHDEIKATIRSNMANTRAANASPGGNYSGAMSRAKQAIANQNKPQATASTNNKYQSELNKAKSNAAAEAANKEKVLEQKHATYEKEKAERKEQKEKERAAQEAAAAAEKAEKEAKKNKKKGSGGKKGSSKKTSDKKKEQEELQKKIDEGVQKELEKMGLSSQAMSKDGQQKSKLSDEQLDSLANKAIRGDLGNGAQRKAALGDYYQEVQSLVNKKMSERAEVAKGAKSPEKKQELKWTGKKVKHTMITGSNYIVHSTTYLEHHGVPGQVHGLRRYQNYDGSLTPLGREHYGIGPSRYQNADGTLTEKGIKKYTTLDKKTGARVLNKKGEKFYKKFEAKVTKQAVKDVMEENKKLVKRRATLSDEEIEQLTNRLNAEKKLRDAYGSTSLWQQAKDNIGKAVARKGSEFVVDVALGAVAAAGQKAVEKSLNGKIGSLNLSDYIDNNKMEVNRERVNKMAEAEKAAKADYEAAVARNKAEKDRFLEILKNKEGGSLNPQASMDAVSLMGKKNAEARKQYEKVLNDLNRAKENYEKSYDEERRQASDRLMADLKRRRDNNYNTAKLIFPTPGSRDKK